MMMMMMIRWMSKLLITSSLTHSSRYIIPHPQQPLHHPSPTAAVTSSLTHSSRYIIPHP